MLLNLPVSDILHVKKALDVLPGDHSQCSFHQAIGGLPDVDLRTGDEVHGVFPVFVDINALADFRLVPFFVDVDG